MKISTRLFALALCATWAFSAASLHAATFTLVDAEGFENNTTTFAGTGRLEGQAAKTFGGTGMVAWSAEVGNPAASMANAIVQSAVVGAGTKAVKVDKVASSDDRWGVFGNFAPVERYVCVDWSMYVEDANGATGTFGPFFGVEVNSDNGGVVARMAGLGVDATTGDVLAFGGNLAGLIETGAVVNFNTWNDFRIILDDLTDSYTAYLNGALVASEAYDDPAGSLAFLTDASISALAAAGDPASQALTGTAYFDDFIMFETDLNKAVPEPTTVAIAGIGMVLSLALRRRQG